MGETDMKKHIFFDYGRTIVKHPAEAEEIFIARGITDGATIRHLQKTVFAMGDYLNRLDEGSLTREAYHEQLKKQIPPALLSAALDAADYHIGELRPLPHMEALLARLKQDGFQLYITSNMDALHSAQMPEVPITRYFDGMLFSAEIGVRKPAVAFFKAALTRFEVAPDECLFLDDLAENVAGAEACGITGLVFRGDALEAEQFIYNHNKT